MSWMLANREGEGGDNDGNDGNNSGDEVAEVTAVFRYAGHKPLCLRWPPFCSVAASGLDELSQDGA